MRLTLLIAGITAITSAYQPRVKVPYANGKVKYWGFERNGIEIFQNIAYGQDTSGANRFKPPKPFIPVPDKNYDATTTGPACPQPLGLWALPLALSEITEISEDCLNLNVARPSMRGGKQQIGPLPVMVWIHGGGFWAGSNMEITTIPDALILESIANGLPVIHVAINYRLGFFGFAQSETLKQEGSENAGLRDQRLAIEWVRDHIAYFGGDPTRITIFGQSSGGLAIGMQLLAYGGTKPLPFQRGIAESQVLEPGITGNFSIDAMSRVANYVGCNTTSIHSPETIVCLRSLGMQTLFNASAETKTNDNVGDIWLPSVDGDFLPAAPSQLLAEGKFGNATLTIGWTEDDLNFFTDFSITTNNDTANFLLDYIPKANRTVIDGLLDLYPVEDFPAPGNTTLTPEFYRAARVFRDTLMVCEPFLVAEAMERKGLTSFLYAFNQTILEPIIEELYNVSHIGVVHTSEFAYIYGNLTHWNTSNYPYNPTAADFELVTHASRSWSTFASIGRPSFEGHDTLEGWGPMFNEDGKKHIYIIGGPKPGYSALDGPNSLVDVQKQRLRERCAVINDPGFIDLLQF